MTNFKKTAMVALLAGLGFTGTSQAALFDRGNGMIYDDYSNITWSANANIAGRMNWADANTWAANLVLGGYNDWRLPTNLTVVDVGHYESVSEMGHLFYADLGADGNTLTIYTNSKNYALFSNIKAYSYWWGSEDPTNPNYAWYFPKCAACQGYTDKNNQSYAWAVRPGDVAAVPVPGAVWLFGSGLMGLLSFTRKKNKTTNLIAA